MKKDMIQDSTVLSYEGIHSVRRCNRKILSRETDVQTLTNYELSQLVDA